MDESIQKFLKAKCALMNKGTWKDWLADLLITLNSEVETFSGKRPNCDSDWISVLAEAMNEAGLTCINSKGDVDWNEQQKHFKAVIQYIFSL